MTAITLSAADHKVIATLKKDFAELWTSAIVLTKGDERKALEVLIKADRLAVSIRDLENI